MRKSLFFLLIAFLLWFMAGPVRAEEYAQIRLAASAPIVGGDLDASRDAAVTEVRRAIVMSALKKKLSPSLQDSEVVKTVFMRNPEPYIARFAIENEEIGPDGKQYEVKATADVREDSVTATLIEKGLCDIFAAEPIPTVMVLVAERFETRVAGTRTTEAALIKILQEKGLKVVDAEQRKALDMRNKVFAEAAGDMVAAVQAATSFAADYLLYGQASVTSSSPLAGTDLKARFATVNLNLIRATSGEVLAVSKGEGNVKHVDELTGGNWSLEAAAQTAGQELLKSLETILKNEALSGSMFVVDVLGLDSEAQLQDIAATLKDKVKSITTRFYFSGVAQLDVQFKGSSGELAQLLAQPVSNSRPFQVQETLPRYVRLVGIANNQAAAADVGDAVQKYNEEKYKTFDLEKARQNNKELLDKIASLAASTKITDDQKKLLYKTQKELEEKERQVGDAQSELEQRKKELAAAEARKRELEARKVAMTKKLEVAQDEQRATGQAVDQERQRLQTDLAQAVNAKETARAQLNQDLQNINNQIGEANQQHYTASRNYGNAQSNAYMTSSDWVGAAQTSNSLLQTITGGGFSFW